MVDVCGGLRGLYYGGCTAYSGSILITVRRILEGVNRSTEY